MKNINIKIRTDADVASADGLVHVPAMGYAIVLAGVFDAIPQPDRGNTRV